MTRHKGDCVFCEAVKAVLSFVGFLVQGTVFLAVVATILWLACDAYGMPPAQEPLEIVLKNEGEPYLLQALASIAVIVTAIAGLLGWKKRKKE